MSESLIANREQAALWNETAGRAWVEMQRVLDEMMAPFIPLLIEHSLNNETCRVLDIGCGAGSTTLSAASRLSPGGLCVGVDISAALLEVARQRAMKEAPSKAAFVQADAQTHAFEPHVFDAVISRFGVMFFDDPQAAFVNIRGAARSDAPLTFVAWRGPAENPFMTAAARAAAPFLTSLRAPAPNAPASSGSQIRVGSGTCWSRAAGRISISARSMFPPRWRNKTSSPTSPGSARLEWR